LIGDRCGDSTRDPGPGPALLAQPAIVSAAAHAASDDKWKIRFMMKLLTS
jgi:hypothetical protein